MEACPFKSKLTGYDNASVKVYDPNSRSATFIRHLRVLSKLFKGKDKEFARTKYSVPLDVSGL